MVGLKNTSIGNTKIIDVKISDAKQLIIDLSQNELREIAKAYNSLYPECQLPNLTPHVLRHTFCTRKVSSGMNIKAVQYLMGHSSVQITLDVYTSIDADMIKTEFAKVAQM